MTIAPRILLAGLAAAGLSLAASRAGAAPISADAALATAAGTVPVQYWGPHRPHWGPRPYRWGPPAYVGPRCRWVQVRRWDPYWGGWRVRNVRRCW